MTRLLSWVRQQNSDTVVAGILSLFLFGGSWKTAPVFGDPGAWYPMIAIWIPLMSVAGVRSWKLARAGSLSVPIGLWLLGIFALWLAIRSYENGGLATAGAVKSARFLIFPLSLACAGFVLARSSAFLRAFTCCSATVGLALVIIALIQNVSIQQGNYGLSSFQENSVVFGWTVGLTLLALLSLTTGATTPFLVLMGSASIGTALAAIGLNGGRGAVLSALVAMVLASPYYLASWRSQRRRLGLAVTAFVSALATLVLSVFLVSGGWTSIMATASTWIPPVTIAPAFSQTSPENSSQSRSSPSAPVTAAADTSRPDTRSLESTTTRSVIGRTMSIQQDASPVIRLAAWSYAFDEFVRAPLFGHGTGTFSFNAIVAGRDRGTIEYPHNIVFEAAVETGFVGTSLLIASMISAIAASRRLFNSGTSNPIGPWHTYVAGGLVFSICVSLLSGDLQMNRNIWLFAGIAWGILAQAQSKTAHRNAMEKTEAITLIS